MYLHHLPSFKPLESLFKAAGYTLDVDLSNSLFIYEGDSDNEIEHDDLPEELKEALNKFAAENNLS